MPTTRRRLTRQRKEDEIRPSVLHYLQTGDLDAAWRDNPWLIVSLMAPEGRAARDAWQAGDESAARVWLGKCPGLRKNFFVA